MVAAEKRVTDTLGANTVKHLQVVNGAARRTPETVQI